MVLFEIIGSFSVRSAVCLLTSQKFSSPLEETTLQSNIHLVLLFSNTSFEHTTPLSPFLSNSGLPDQFHTTQLVRSVLVQVASQWKLRRCVVGCMGRSICCHVHIASVRRCVSELVNRCCLGRSSLSQLLNLKSEHCVSTKTAPRRDDAGRTNFWTQLGGSSLGMKSCFRTQN